MSLRGQKINIRGNCVVFPLLLFQRGMAQSHHCIESHHDRELLVQVLKKLRRWHTTGSWTFFVDYDTNYILQKTTRCIKWTARWRLSWFTSLSILFLRNSFFWTVSIQTRVSRPWTKHSVSGKKKKNSNSFLLSRRIILFCGAIKRICDGGSSDTNSTSHHGSK